MTTTTLVPGTLDEIVQFWEGRVTEITAMALTNPITETRSALETIIDRADGLAIAWHFETWVRRGNDDPSGAQAANWRALAIDDLVESLREVYTSAGDIAVVHTRVGALLRAAMR